MKEEQILKKVVFLLSFPLGAIDLDGFYHFCPICGDLYPLHHSGVEHTESIEHTELMENYFKKGNENAKEVAKYVIQNNNYLLENEPPVVNVHQSWVKAGLVKEGKSNAGQ